MIATIESTGLAVIALVFITINLRLTVILYQKLPASIQLFAFPPVSAPRQWIWLGPTVYVCISAALVAFAAKGAPLVVLILGACFLPLYLWAQIEWILRLCPTMRLPRGDWRWP
jgi:hypothetical protein